METKGFRVRSAMLAVAGSVFIAAHAEAAVSCHKINAKGIGKEPR